MSDGALVDPLDNPIWSALSTHQRAIAESREHAARFPPAFTALAALRAPDARSYGDLAELLGPGEIAGLFLDAPAAVPATLVAVEQIPLAQMVLGADAGVTGAGIDAVELGADDVPAMVSLAALTRPGPFGPRTRELGSFVGVRVQGELVAMAGQRLWLPGFREISAVCTHPAHLGRGYAAGLMAQIARRIRAAGETPFLHVRADNARAIAVYARLGYAIRRQFVYARIARV